MYINKVLYTQNDLNFRGGGESFRWDKRASSVTDTDCLWNKNYYKKHYYVLEQCKNQGIPLR